MKESKKKVALIVLLVGTVVLVLLTLVAVVYFMGKDVSNEDTSAAVNDASGIILDDGSTNNEVCDFSGSFAYCLPKYAFADSRAQLFVNYWDSMPGGNSANWEITICNRVRRTTEPSKEYTFSFSNKPCTITIKLFPGTENEEVFSKAYTPIKNIKNFKMAVPTYASRVGVDYDGSIISGDLTNELLAKGITPEMVEDVVWNYKYNSDVCSGYVYSNYTDPLKYSGYMHPESVGKCRIRLTANVVTCSNCETGPKVVYQSTKIINMEVTGVGVLPSPTSSWLIPTPVPTNVVSPTPTVRVSGSLVPTVTSTPAIYPTVSAVKLVPAATSVSANSEKSVEILGYLPTTNIDGLQIRLNVTGATIVPGSYVTSASNTIAIGTCDENRSSTTSSGICVDIVKTNGAVFAMNESIGSFKILAGTDSPIIITTATDNAYLVNESLVGSKTQILAEYNVTP